MSKIPDPIGQSFIDIYSLINQPNPFVRGVAFNVKQAETLFAPTYVVMSMVLCVDGPVCKWVECYQHAVDFFEPLTHYKCECGFEALDRSPEDGDLYLCHECKSIMLATDHGELRKKLAKIVAGDL